MVARYQAKGKYQSACFKLRNLSVLLKLNKNPQALLMETIPASIQQEFHIPESQSSYAD